MSKTYWRPIPQTDRARPPDALPLGGGWSWFNQCEAIDRNGPTVVVPISDVPKETLTAICKPRADVAGLSMSQPKIMGILNVTPDSFSDGGDFVDPQVALGRATEMAVAGADIIDVGGESTRPGADFVSSELEISRTLPIVEALSQKLDAPISIDTRKADVARANLSGGASIFNDVSALSFDPLSAATAAELDATVCLMHASGDPKTMQDNLDYSDVLLDVYDYLEDRRNAAVATGINPNQIILDPGIGFGKTVEQNMAMLCCLSLFHCLGCPILVGASRKRFIGKLAAVDEAKDRMPGSIAVALEAVRQGVQIVRVHDVSETKQALTIWSHLNTETK